MTTEDRFFAELTPHDLIAWSWRVVDRLTGEQVEYALDLAEGRAKRIAFLLNRAERAGPALQFDGFVAWVRDERGRMIAYVECDRLRRHSDPGIKGRVTIHDRPYECLDVIATPAEHAGSFIRPGEPIGLVLRT